MPTRRINPPTYLGVPVDGATIDVHHYAAGGGTRSGLGVLLVHGLLASSELFDVPGLEDLSFARRLAASGVDVVSYDQRGAGRSQPASWHFGLETHALRDLPAVLAACRTAFGFERVVLIGHSLGGLLWLEWLRSFAAGRSVPPGLPDVAAGVAIACPGALDRRHAPWKTVVARGPAFIAGLDRNDDAVVDRAEFAVGQVVLAWPWARRLLHPRATAALMDAGARSRVGAGLVRRLPLPTLIYSRDDFDDDVFQAVLRSDALSRAPLQLFRDLYARLVQDAIPQVPPIDLPVLGIGSSVDRFVPLPEVQAFAAHFATAAVLSTEDTFGQPSGHAGYFFKAGLRDRVFDRVLSFVRGVLRRA